MWLLEEELENLKLDIYLHGICHQWVKENYKENDEIIILTEIDYETGRIFLIHCCLFRNEEYLDVRGNTNDLEEVLEGFDYYNYEENKINNLEEFMKIINDLGIDFE